MRSARAAATPRKSDMDIIESLPEAPTYRPTLEEFADPLQYIESIRHEAEQFGICKIVPPDSWKPPFAIKTSTLRYSHLFSMFFRAVLESIDGLTFVWRLARFKTRVQNLNALDAETRSKANFIDQLKKFYAKVCSLVVLSRYVTRWLFDGRAFCCKPTFVVCSQLISPAFRTVMCWATLAWTIEW